MDISPYVAVPGIVVILSILYAVAISAQSARDQQDTMVFVRAGAEGLFVGFFRGALIVGLWCLLCYLLNATGMGRWHPQYFMRVVSIVCRQTWVGLLMLACILLSAAEAVIHAASHNSSPYGWPFRTRPQTPPGDEDDPESPDHPAVDGN